MKGLRADVARLALRVVRARLDRDRDGLLVFFVGVVLLLSFIDVADELLFERVLDRVEREVACVEAHLREGLPTETCADPLPTYEPPFGQEDNAALAPLEPLKRPKNDDPTLKEAVDALKKGENVRIPGLLDERIEECGPNRNCYAAVKRERNASKPPLEEFLSRFLGQK